MAGKKGKLARLREDPQVGRWLRNLARGSPITAEGMGRKLSRLCELLSTDPSGLVAWAGRDLQGFQDALEDMVAGLEAEEKSPGTIVGFLKAARSWLRHHDIVLTRKVKVSNRSATPTIEDEQVPSKEELGRIFRASKPRVRAAEALMALADLRPQTLGNHDGKDGLMVKDLPEMRVEGGEVLFERVPTTIIVRPTLSKAKHKYFTFLIGEGCTYLKEYLEERMRSGEGLGPESPIISHERPRVSTQRFLLTRKISHLIRKAMRRAGVYKRPYVLRAYAETQLIIAESRGKISHPYLQFIAGHKGDIEARYSTNKGILPPEMIEDMRGSVQACEPFLGTTTQKLDQSAVVKEAKVEALKSIAKSLLGVDLVEVKIAKERELDRQLNPDETIDLFENELKKSRERKEDPQRIVKEEALETYLSEGWEFVSVLPSRKILIRKA